MSELRPYGRELLEAARRERSPNQDERARMLKALLADEEHARLAAPGGPSNKLSLATRVMVLLLLAALIAFGVYMAGHAGVPRR